MRSVLIISIILFSVAGFALAVEDTTQVSLIVNNPPNPEVVQNIGTASLLTVVMNIFSSRLVKILLVIAIILGLGIFFFLRKFKITKRVSKVAFLSKTSQNKEN